MPVLAAYAVFSVIGVVIYGLMYLGSRLAGDDRQEATYTAGFISVALMLPFFVITLLVTWIQHVAQVSMMW